MHASGFFRDLGTNDPVLTGVQGFEAAMLAFPDYLRVDRTTNLVLRDATIDLAYDIRVELNNLTVIAETAPARFRLAG